MSCERNLRSTCSCSVLSLGGQARMTAGKHVLMILSPHMGCIAVVRVMASAP